MAKSRKKKKSSSGAQKFSVNSFLKNQLRKLPVEQCYITPDWQEIGIATIIIIRKHVNGNYSAAMFYVDLLCEGVRDTHFIINEPEYELDELLNDKDEACSYELAHNILWGAIDFADEIGLKPHKDFAKTQYFLEEDTDEIEFIDIEFGKSGRPIVCTSNEGNRSRLIATLDKTIGRENFGILNIKENSYGFENLPLEYDELGFYNQEEMMDELIIRNSREEVEEYFDVFYELFKENKTVNFGSLPKNYSDITIVRIIETMYFTTMATQNNKDPEYQELFAQLFFDDIPDSPFDIAEDKITYEPIDLGYNKTKEENKAYIQLVNKIKAKKKDVTGFIKKQIDQYPDNPQFKGLLYKYWYESEGVNQMRGIEKDYDKNPEYLFFKLYYGELLIEDNNFEKVNEIFDNKTTLDELYPERTIFHITEFVGFCHFFIKFYLAMGKLETAIQYYDALSKYYVEGNEELIDYIDGMVLKAKADFLSAYAKMNKEINFVLK